MLISFFSLSLYLTYFEGKTKKRIPIKRMSESQSEDQTNKGEDIKYTGNESQLKKVKKNNINKNMKVDIEKKFLLTKKNGNVEAMTKNNDDDDKITDVEIENMTKTITQEKKLQKKNMRKMKRKVKYDFYIGLVMITAMWIVPAVTTLCIGLFWWKMQELLLHLYLQGILFGTWLIIMSLFTLTILINNGIINRQKYI